METFVIRIWTPASAQETPSRPLRGLAEHVGAYHPALFRNAAELVAFLEKAIALGRTEVDG